MSLNINNVSAKVTNPNAVPLDVNFGQGGLLPVDLFRRIFQDLKADLPSVAMVCKNWKALADDEVFRNLIRPAQTFGTQEWKEYIGVDAGEEPSLPRRAYGDLEKKGDFLTFIPEKVKVIQENGNSEDMFMDIENVKEMSMDNLEVIGKLVENPKKGHKTGYAENFWKEVFQEKRILQKPHWVWIKKEVMGRNKRYDDQQKLAKTFGANISGLIDTAISIFMEYVRSGERNFVWDPPVNGQRTVVRVNETTKEWRICLGFAPAGLTVSNSYDYDYDPIGFVCARKSFGT